MISEDGAKLLNPTIYAFDEFKLEAENLLLLRNSEVVPLAPKAVEVLRALIEADGNLITKKQILDKVWANTFVEEANLTHHISALRKALGEDKNGRKFIETIPRRGYRFVTEVNRAANFEASEIVITERDSVKIVEAATFETDNLAVKDFSIIENQPPISAQKNRRKIVWSLTAATIVLLIGATTFFGYRNFYASKKSVAPTEITFKRLTPDADATAPSISPDGASIVFARAENGKETLWRKQIASGELTQLLPAAPMQESRIATTRFSPDGRWIYYLKFIAKETADILFRIPAAGGAEQRILTDNFESDFSISPDGKQIAYTLDWRQLVVADVETGNKRIVVERDGTKNVIKTEINSVAWSPDGSRLVFSGGMEQDSRNIQQMFEINLLTGEERQIPIPEDFHARQIEWLADDSGLIVTRGWMANQIWRVDHRTGATTRISNETDSFQFLRLSADSKTLVAEQSLGQYNIWTAPADNLDKKRQITIGASARQGSNGLLIMPDGKIVFTSTTSGAVDIWTMNADGSERKQLTVNAGKYNDVPKMTSDGRYIVFRSGRSGTAQVWRMDADGRNPVQISKAVEINGFSLAPDDYVYYKVFLADRRKYQIYKVSAAGGEPVEFNDQNLIEVPLFSPDGKWYLFYSPPTKDEKPRAGLVEMATGKIVRYIDTPVAIFGWSPDSKAIIHTFADFNKLWRLPIDGGETQQIADFSPLKITTWKYSPDGKQMVFSLGNTTNEIVMIQNFLENAK